MLQSHLLVQQLYLFLQLATLVGDVKATSATTFDAPALATTTGTIDIAAAATVHLKNLASSSTTGTLKDIATIVTLKLFEQETNVDFTTAAKILRTRLYW